MRIRTILLLVVLLSPLALAASATHRFTVEGEDVLVEHAYTLDDERIMVRLPSDATAITVDGEPRPWSAEATLSGTGETVLSYRTQTLLERGSQNYFVADLSRSPASIETATVLLPEGTFLSRGLADASASIHPRPTEAGTDGTRLVFTWTGPALEPSRAILIGYERSAERLGWWIVLAAVIAIAAVVAWRMFPWRGADRSQNLYADEKAVVRLLESAPGHELWQGELVRQSGLSKVKVSRRIRALEAKGVVERVPVGNSNRIRLK